MTARQQDFLKALLEDVMRHPLNYKHLGREGERSADAVRTTAQSLIEVIGLNW